MRLITVLAFLFLAAPALAYDEVFCFEEESTFQDVVDYDLYVSGGFVHGADAYFSRNGQLGPNGRRIWCSNTLSWLVRPFLFGVRATHNSNPGNPYTYSWALPFHYAREAPGPGPADLDGDGSVLGTDYNVLNAFFGQPSPYPTHPVPTP